MFSQDLQGPFAFGSSGFQAGQWIPYVFHALSLLWFMLFGAGSGISVGLSMSRCRLGDLIGESAGATLPTMSAKMAIISWSETAFAMV